MNQIIEIKAPTWSAAQIAAAKIGVHWVKCLPPDPATLSCRVTDVINGLVFLDKLDEAWRSCGSKGSRWCLNETSSRNLRDGCFRKIPNTTSRHLRRKLAKKLDLRGLQRKAKVG